MTVVMSNTQMSAIERRYAETQIRQAAKDLHEKAHKDYDLPQIEEALRGIVDRATPLGIKRMKWLKILTLWHLYPAAAPDPLALEEILQGDAHQDTRMRRALALPTGPDAAQ